MSVTGGHNLQRYLRQAQAKQAAMPRAVQVGVFGEAAIDAIVNEFGLPQAGIPERPALRKAIATALDDVRREIARRVVDGAVTVVDAKAIGRVMLWAMDREVRAFSDPRNRPWKQPSNPLEFTGRLLKSLGIKIIR